MTEQESLHNKEECQKNAEIVMHKIISFLDDFIIEYISQVECLPAIVVEIIAGVFMNYIIFLYESMEDKSNGASLFIEIPKYFNFALSKLLEDDRFPYKHVIDEHMKSADEVVEVEESKENLFKSLINLFTGR